MIIDMHVHTTLGSADSSLTPAALVEGARAAGLDGVVIAEHVRQWTPEQVRCLQAESGLFVYPAVEWVCEYGHVLVLGVDAETRFTGPLQEMRRIVQAQDGYMILAHPFRYFPGSMSLLFNRWPNHARLSPDELSTHPAFGLVDEIETLNNHCTDSENGRALAVACTLGRRGVAGSDAHGRDELGRCVTVFEQPIEDGTDLLRQLRSGSFHTRRNDVWT
jgi:predicted metal-dependent phosphoesterase TrpH